MKNFLLIAVFAIAISAISFVAGAQPSIKFIEGIELKPDMVEHSTASTSAAVSYIGTEKKVTNSSSTLLKLATEECKSLQFKYAQLMDIEIEGIANYTLFNFIEEWWDTRYRYGGESKKGIDCSALTGLLLTTVYGIKLPRTAREQYAASERINRDELKEGDLVFFNTRGGVSHVGVYLANDYFVHASVANGVTISSLNDDYYNRKYMGGGRVIPITEPTN
jgi:lipoprotein Spr